MAAQPQQANQGYPIPGTPVVMPDTGLATQVWARFFLTLWSALFGTFRLGQLIPYVSPVNIPLTSGVVTVIGSLNLPAGNWEISGTALFIGSATSMNAVLASIGGNPAAGVNRGFYVGPAVNDISINPPNYSVSLSSPSTIDFNVDVFFLAGTVNAMSNMMARRVSMVNN